MYFKSGDMKEAKKGGCSFQIIRVKDLKGFLGGVGRMPGLHHGRHYKPMLEALIWDQSLKKALGKFLRTSFAS